MGSSSPRYYKNLNAALDALYEADRANLIHIDFDDDFNDDYYYNAANEIARQGGYTPEFLTTPEGSALVSETFRVLDKAVDKALQEQPDPAVAAALRENAFIFSGFKTHAELEQVSKMLTDDKGNIRPFNEFLKDVEALNDKYNHRYLRTEYNQALQAAQMAAKWADFERNKDFINLQYRTANDERVRASHRILHGTTLPVDDKFWKQYTPPNGWGCRCTVVAVPKDDYPTQDSHGSIAKAETCFKTPKEKMFKENLAEKKKLFPSKHPYLPKGCGNCGKTLLAYNPNRLICKACSAIRKVFKRECESKKQYDAKVAARNRLLHDESTLKKIANIEANTTLQVNNNPLNNNGATIKVKSEGKCLVHTIKSMFSDPDYILKNEDLKKFDTTLFHNTVCVDWKACDTTHNGRTTQKLKAKIDYFFYFETKLSNGSTVYLHVAHFKPKYGGGFELYHISRKL